MSDEKERGAFELRWESARADLAAFSSIKKIEPILKKLCLTIWDAGIDYVKSDLIEEFEKSKHYFPSHHCYHHPRGVGYNEGMDDAISIVRAEDKEKANGG